MKFREHEASWVRKRGVCVVWGEDRAKYYECYKMIAPTCYKTPCNVLMEGIRSHSKSTLGKISKCKAFRLKHIQ